MPSRRGSTAGSAREQDEPRNALKSRAALNSLGALHAGPLFTWAILQVVAIGLAAARVPLAAQYPVIGEFHASQVLLAVQLPLAAMLMPVLLTNWRSTLAASLLAGLLQSIASLLTDVPPAQTIPCVIYIVLWVAAMGVMCGAMRDSGALLSTGGGMSALVAGGPLLIYLGADLSSRATVRDIGGPVLPMLQNWPSVPLSAWIWLAVVMCSGIGIRLVFQAFLTRSRDASTECKP